MALRSKLASISALRLSALYFASFVALSLGSVQKVLPRGANPELSRLYIGAEPAGTFTCKDGSRSIPFQHVNDDFCDCVDGSDEPGTAACPRGSFYCKNKGHEPKVIHSGFVDDGVCDCCDGSDEEKGKCPNECMASAEAELKELEKKMAHYAEGLKKQQVYLSSATEVRKGWADRLLHIDGEIENQKAVVEELRAKKQTIEEREEAEEAKRAEEARLKKEAEEAATGSAQEGESGAQGAVDEDGEVDVYDGDYPDMSDYTFGAEGGEGDIPEEEDPDEVGRRIASRWTSDPEAAGGGAEDGYYGAANQDGGNEAGEGDYTHIPDYVDYANEEEYDEGDGTYERGGDEGSGVDKSEGHKIRSDFRREDNALRDLENERSSLTQKLGANYGPSGVWAPLDGKCISAVVDKYTYEVCIFGEAKQKEGHSSTSLGKWQGGLEAGELVYEGGQSCWQGPKRSMRVRLECGSTESLANVEEPSRCEYQAVLHTPAACSQQDLEASQAKLQELTAMLREAHDEL
mmetsp:Transcript_39665/g.112495  ORF Transcript_39665/g.112495 Transcript_39665/m.112495 type:complete len:518 (-) Transcript_39665:249-1802(-)|eukprot:CAMPEP_0117680348 /NCGR_PEP_ID=MMETSP0804-20121206/18303_1 /TAXON_ID=1074897 /ORGANISM="Tetraselmis astigmatica, Strain CCMP880" /LENGTH=517 /DNA_ID=CAMNT_0005489837 /DNA_START=17 /DNA_END=1570 /DNA_ORIENTATION=-